MKAVQHGVGGEKNRQVLVVYIVQTLQAFTEIHPFGNHETVLGKQGEFVVGEVVLYGDGIKIGV